MIKISPDRTTQNHLAQANDELRAHIDEKVMLEIETAGERGSTVANLMFNSFVLSHL